MAEGIRGASFDVRRLAQGEVVSNFLSTHEDPAITELWGRSDLVQGAILRGVSVALASSNPQELVQRSVLEMSRMKTGKISALIGNHAWGPNFKSRQIRRVEAMFDGTVPDPSTITTFERTEPKFFDGSVARFLTQQEVAMQIDYGRHLVGILRGLEQPTQPSFSRMQITAASALAQLAYATFFDGQYVHQDFNGRVKAVGALSLLATAGILKEQRKSQVRQDRSEPEQRTAPSPKRPVGALLDDMKDLLGD